MQPDKLDDQIIAGDLLIDAKLAVRNYANALTETYSSDVHSVLTRQLNDAIDSYQKISKFMLEKKYFNSLELQRQTMTGDKHAVSAKEKQVVSSQIMLP